VRHGETLKPVLSQARRWAGETLSPNFGDTPDQDSRSRMIRAAAQLFRQRGYHATAFSDVIQASGAPRGSTYFHFPGGKQELAREATALAGDEIEQMVAQAAGHSDGPGSFVAFTALDALRDGYEVYPVVDAIAGTSPEAPSPARRVRDVSAEAACASFHKLLLLTHLHQDWRCCLLSRGSLRGYAALP
jgi:AcrR family transcriptional regulator